MRSEISSLLLLEAVQIHGFLALGKSPPTLGSPRRLKEGLPPPLRDEPMCGETDSLALHLHRGSAPKEVFPPAASVLKSKYPSPASHPEEISQDLSLLLAVTNMKRAGWFRETEAQSTKCCIPPLTLSSLKLEEACLPAQKPQGFTPPLTSAFDFFSPSLILLKLIACREKLHGRASSPTPRLGRQRACLARGCFTLFRTASPG